MKCAPCFAVRKWGQIPTNASHDFLQELSKLPHQDVVCSLTPVGRLVWSVLTLMVRRHLLTPTLPPFALMAVLLISLNSSPSSLPFVLLMCLQPATILPPRLLLTQLCAGAGCRITFVNPILNPTARLHMQCCPGRHLVGI